MPPAEAALTGAQRQVRGVHALDLDAHRAAVALAVQAAHAGSFERCARLAPLALPVLAVERLDHQVQAIHISRQRALTLQPSGFDRGR